MMMTACFAWSTHAQGRLECFACAWSASDQEGVLRAWKGDCLMIRTILVVVGHSLRTLWQKLEIGVFGKQHARAPPSSVNVSFFSLFFNCFFNHFYQLNFLSGISRIQYEPCRSLRAHFLFRR